MNQASGDNLAKKSASTFKLMTTVTLRILGIRNKHVSENELQRLTGVQVGIACAMALIGFTAIIAILSVVVVKTMS